MKDAGYENGLTLRLLGESTINFQTVAEQLSAMLAEIGITLDISLMDYAAQNAVLYSGDDNAFDLYLSFSQCSDESISYIDNPMLFGLSKWASSSDGSGPGFQSILSEIRVTPDQTTRAQLYRDVQTYFFEKGLYWLPLNETQNYVGCSSDLTGFRFNGSLIYFEGVYFK
jgi:ABC-type transport system substrate-binding protein